MPPSTTDQQQADPRRARRVRMAIIAVLATAAVLSVWAWGLSALTSRVGDDLERTLRDPMATQPVAPVAAGD